MTGRDAMRRYLARLFGAWKMTWTAREVSDLGDEDAVIEIDGMDLAVLRGDRVARNEVYFDRTALGLGLSTA